MNGAAMDKLISDEFLDNLLAKAGESPRRRSHHNFHESPESAVQRLCIGLQPGTYVRPHRHPESNKWEMMIILRGSVRVLLYDETGVVESVVTLSDGEADSKGIEIPAGKIHSVQPIGGSAVILEFKEGPFKPSGPANFAEWAPGEGDVDVPDYLKWSAGAEPGSRWASQI